MKAEPKISKGRLAENHRPQSSPGQHDTKTKMASYLPFWRRRAVVLIAMPKKRERKLILPPLCAVVLLVTISILLSYLLASLINPFFEGLVGEEAQARLQAPFVEELLKPLGLVVLAIALRRARRAGRAGAGWLESVRACYGIGYASGLAFGALENWLSYGTFSGFRAATPFLHAVETGLVGVGIYYVLTRGRRGLGRWVFMYSLAVLLHFAWNSGSPAVWGVLGTSATVIGLGAFSLLLGLGRRGRR